MHRTLSFTPFWQRALRYFVLSLCLSLGAAWASTEPTMAQVYAAAQAGKLQEAQTMVQQVLVAHPNSAKAYFVQSELYARQGDGPRARDALAQAERLAPGLPFAKPEAVNALRAQLNSAANIANTSNAATRTPATNMPPSASAGNSGNNWLLPALLAGGVIVLGYIFFRRKTNTAATPYASMPGTGSQGLQGPQTFGNGMGQPAQPMYGQPGYGQPGYAQPGSGLGSKIVGGVATGLAVGAGVMAAQAIAKNLSGDQSTPTDNNHQPNVTPLGNSNADMGGDNFGIQDNGSWDDAGGGVDAGGDWDN